MDFAKKQLEKYGWKEGQGLGKNEDGISAAIKPKLKFDNAGIGHEQGKEFTNNWWERIYNNALENVEVDSVEGKVNMQVKSEDAVEITTKSYSLNDLKKSNKKLEYQGTFLKTATLTQNGLTKSLQETSDNEEATDFSLPKFKPLSDDELFAACGGRTAHKGARHGLKLTGKLSRIEKQEKMLLKKLKNVSLTDNRESLEKKIKKLSKHKDKHSTKELEENINFLSLDDYDSRSSGSVTPKKKYKHRKKRSVSFSETVTSYITHDVNIEKSDGSTESEPKTVQFTVVKMVKIKEEPSSIRERKDEDGADEGIEQDCDTNSTEDNSNHKSFELAQSSNPEKAKKISKSKKHDRATLRFLRKFAEHQKKDVLHSIDHCPSCKKRKKVMNEDPERDILTDIEKIQIDDQPSTKKIKVEKVDKSDGDSEKQRKDKQKRKHRKKKERDGEANVQEYKEIKSITKSLNKKCKISDDSE